MEPVIDLKPSWEARRYWWIDPIIVLIAATIIFNLASGIIAFKLIQPWDIPRQRAVDISHEIFKKCIELFVPDGDGNAIEENHIVNEKCGKVADETLKLAFKNEKNPK